MNRADKMLSVLKDGRTYSRLEIMERVGFMMTNNAAAELRARGVRVEHRKEKGVDVYQLVGVLDEAASAGVAASSSAPPSNPLGDPPLHGAADPRHKSGDGRGVLTLFGDAA